MILRLVHACCLNFDSYAPIRDDFRFGLPIQFIESPIEAARQNMARSNCIEKYAGKYMIIG